MTWFLFHLLNSNKGNFKAIAADHFTQVNLHRKIKRVFLFNYRVKAGK